MRRLPRRSSEAPFPCKVVLPTLVVWRFASCVMGLPIDIDIAAFFRKNGLSYWGDSIGWCGSNGGQRHRQVRWQKQRESTPGCSEHRCPQALALWAIGADGLRDASLCAFGVTRRGTRIVPRVLSDKLRYVWYCTPQEGHARMRYSRRHVCQNPKWAPCSNLATGSL